MDKRQKTLLITFLLSLLLHVVFFWLLEQRSWLFISADDLEKPIPQDVTFVFPENKPDADRPREVVQNMNENEEIPDDASLLSEANSRARNPERSESISQTPMSSGNTPFSNLSNAPSKKVYTPLQNKKFNKEALRGTSSKTPSERYQEQQKASTSSIESEGSNQMLEQKAFSVEEMGALTLSTYKWKWAPYINAMKNKLGRVWYPPSAYYQLGLIHGHTIVKYTINREGEVLGLTVLDHQGHESLKISSTKAIESLFPFLPLPDDFPDETLTIRAKLVYPDLRRRR